MTEAVLTDVADGVAVITINRPEARNAVNGAVARGIAAAVEEFDGRSDVSVLILTGAGANFSSGMDLKGFLSGDAPIAEGRGFGGIVERPPAKPVIAAVEGYALAGGFELVLACDLIVASEEAKFGLPEVRRGLVAGAGGLLRLPSRVPYHLAMEIALTGEHFSAARLADAGLVSKLVPAGEALSAAKELAARVALGRSARARGVQAGDRRVERLVRGRGVPQARRGHQPDLRVERRDGGRDGVRGEAAAGLEGRVALA